MFRPILTVVLCLPALAAEQDLKSVLKGVEVHYNQAKTLQVEFVETYSVNGKPRRKESGLLTLRKPGRMRWEYRDPAGKLFVSDGKDVYYYTPASNRVEKMKLKETEDMRAPLAFLLGKLDFDRDFQEMKYEAVETGGWKIAASPKSDRLPYSAVNFVVGLDYSMRHLDIQTQEGATITFDFRDERMNPKVNDSLFRFPAPPGAVFVDSTTGQESR